MPPDVWLILVSALLAAAGYFLWVGERLPRTRALLGLLALVALAVSVVLHDVITSRQATSAAWREVSSPRTGRPCSRSIRKNRPPPQPTSRTSPLSFDSRMARDTKLT